MTAPTTPGASTADVEALDETVELILDTGNALCSVLADEVPHEELEALVRELAAELFDVYRTVTAEGARS